MTQQPARALNNAGHPHGAGTASSSGQRLAQLADDVTREATRRLSQAAETGQTVSATEYRRHAESVVETVLEEFTQSALEGGGRLLDRATEDLVKRRVLARVSGLGPVQPLLEDPEVENVILSGTRVVLHYADGRREQHPAIFASADQLVAWVRHVAARAPEGEKRFDPSAPLLNMQLPEAAGSRLHAVMEVAREPTVTIRCHRYRTTSLDELRQLGTVDATLVDLLGAAVRARRNVVVTGGASAGKTTLLRALAAEIPSRERLVTIEDILELGLDHDRRAHPDVEALHYRPPNVEGHGEITIATLVREALRMSPDRVIVGETRGSETVPLLNAMSQGNDGSLTTLHAPSSAAAFPRLGAYAAQSSERLDLEATALLVSVAVHVVAHIAPTPTGGRMVTSVREVVGAEGQHVISNEIYRRDRRSGQVHQAAPPSDETREALAEAGFDSRRLQAEVAGWAR